jgi:hypothetical protein
MIQPSNTTLLTRAASPGIATGKSNFPWMFGRLALLRFMIYLPLRFVRAFVSPFPAWPIRSLHLSDRSASLALPTAGSLMPSADFCSAVSRPCGKLSRLRGTKQISRGKFSRLQRAIAGSTLRVLDGYGLHGKSAVRPTLTPCIRFLSIDPRFCSTLPSDPASRR